MKEILGIIHKTIYQFLNICGDDEEVPISDKDKLLLEVNKSICNNLEALEQEPCEDCISREDALMALTGEWTELTDELIHRFIRRIKNLPPVNPQPKTGHWIPVSERLPEENVEVLVTTEWGSITIAERYSANDYFINEGATNADENDIIAWMSLPEPYKAEGSEE